MQTVAWWQSVKGHRVTVFYKQKLFAMNIVSGLKLSCTVLKHLLASFSVIYIVAGNDCIEKCQPILII
jgi:hypothetical protein